MLEVRGLGKRYGAFATLDGVDLTLRAGEIHALLGENGAGKSTLIKTATGVTPRDAGTVTLDGAPIEPRSPADAARLGIATAYQEVNLLPNLTVAGNLFFGRAPTQFGLLREREMRRRVEAVLPGLGVHVDVAAPLGHYSVAVQHLVAIARAVDMSARVLILDEPTASLDKREVAVLFGALRGLAARGIAILFVTHFLDQVYALCDRITVLRNGRLMGSETTTGLPRLAGLAGIAFSLYTSSGYSLSAVGVELDSIAAVVIGGTLLSGGAGSVLGTFVGVLIQGLILTYINLDGTLSSWWAKIATGLLLFAFLTFQQLGASYMRRRLAAAR